MLVTVADPSDQTGLGREVVIRDRRMQDGSSLRLFPSRITWSPDGRYLLLLAVTQPVVASPLIAVPTDPDAPVMILADVDGIVSYDGYDDTTFVPIQVWGRR